MNSKLKKIETLIEVLSKVRVGCPWDIKQTMDSLKPLTIEECYELVDAVTDNDTDHIKEELGDLLMHIFFYAQIAAEQNKFDIGDVAQTISEKLIRRHPHIFGDVSVNDEHDVARNWEKIKIEEKREKGAKEGVLSGVPSSLPPMIKAQRIQHKAAGVGFDWEQKEDIWAKLTEEIDESRHAIAQDEQQAIEEEFGDMLFTMINLARAYGIDPNNALERCNRKFIHRFEHIEEGLKQRGTTFADTTTDEMEELWAEAKKK